MLNVWSCSLILLQTMSDTAEYFSQQNLYYLTAMRFCWFCFLFSNQKALSDFSFLYFEVMLSNSVVGFFFFPHFMGVGCEAAKNPPKNRGLTYCWPAVSSLADDNSWKLETEEKKWSGQRRLDGPTPCLLRQWVSLCTVYLMEAGQIL